MLITSFLFTSKNAMNIIKFVSVNKCLHEKRLLTLINKKNFDSAFNATRGPCVAVGHARREFPANIDQSGVTSRGVIADWSRGVCCDV